MTTQLAKVKIDGKVYFQDDRLREYRHVLNPHDKISFEEIGERKVEPVETKKSLTNKPKLR